MAELKDTSNYLREVKNQYENYPYPLRNPEDEKKRIVQTGVDNLDWINHYCFSAKQTFNNNFRALIAGGGTGDALISLAEQLRDKNAEIVYLDLSKASMEIAKQRAEVRKLNNIKWINASLLDLPKLNIGKFDYINCTGVLHHLDSTEEGLSALTSVLDDDGAMLVMLYAKYGRLAIYPIQEMMRIVNKNEPDLQNKVDNCKSILSELPQSNWLQFDMKDVDKAAKNGLLDDITIYDKFLHSHDRAFSINDVYDLTEKEKLELLYLFYNGSPLGNNLYKPETYFKDLKTLNKIKQLPLKDQLAILEILNGKNAKHTFYASRKKNPIPSVSNLDNIPELSIIFNFDAHLQFSQAITQSNIGQTAHFQRNGRKLDLKIGKYTSDIFKYMDGKKSIKKIITKILSKPSSNKPKFEEVQKEFEYIFNTFMQLNWIFLKNKNTPEYKRFDEIQKRVTDIYSKQQETLFSLDMK